MTKLFALGGVAAVGAGVLAAARMARRRSSTVKQMNEMADAFDYGDLDSPVVVSEELVIIDTTPP